jgi:hypothetical protein
VIFIDLWRVTSNKSSLLSTDDQIFMVETMIAKAVSYAPGEFLEFSRGGILVFIFLNSVDRSDFCQIDQ